MAAELGTFAGTLVGDGYSGNRAAADKVVGEIVTAGCVWVDLDNRLASEDRAFGFEAGVRLHVFRLISVGAMYSMIEEDDLVAVSARLAF